MKKTVSIVLMGVLVAGAFASAPAQAKKKRKPKRIERTVEGTYQLPPLVIAGTCASADAIGCVVFANGVGEEYLTAKVEDAHGQPVAVSVSANTDGNIGDDETYGAFCGETTEPIVVPAGMELHFWVGAATDVGTGGCIPGAATTGTVTVTFSNMP